MGQNKEQLNKLLDFIDQLAKDKDNAWFVKRLREKYGLNSDARIDDIYEYCIEHVIREQATQFYNSFPISELKMQLYGKMMQTFAKEDDVAGKTVFGIKEYLRKSPAMAFDYDAGPIISGFSPSGTAWAIGSATFFEDWETRSRLLRTGEMAGGTVRRKGKRHYRLSQFALVGEAVVLAMRTNSHP